VDRLLLGLPVSSELRERGPEGEVRVGRRTSEEETQAQSGAAAEEEIRVAERERRQGNDGIRRVYALGIGRRKLERALHEIRAPALAVRAREDANLIFALAGDREARDVLRTPGGPDVIAVRSDTYTQILEAVKKAFGSADMALEDFALREAEEGALRVMRDGEPVELLPQNPYIRRLQHEVVARHNLASKSIGTDPRRRIRILPGPVGQ
jgi:hypothetical protein